MRDNDLWLLLSLRTLGASLFAACFSNRLLFGLPAQFALGYEPPSLSRLGQYATLGHCFTKAS